MSTDLPVGTVLFFVLTGVIAGMPTRLFVGGNGAATTVDEVTTYAGVAVDSTGTAAFALLSTTTATWLAGKYQWVLFQIDPTTGNRDQIAMGEIRIASDPNGTSPVDPRTYNEKLLYAIKCTLAGKVNDDIVMYKIGAREVTKMPMADLLKVEAVIEARVRRERMRRGEKVPTSTIGIQFGGRG